MASFINCKTIIGCNVASVGLYLDTMISTIKRDSIKSLNFTNMTIYYINC